MKCVLKVPQIIFIGFCMKLENVFANSLTFKKTSASHTIGFQSISKVLELNHASHIPYFFLQYGAAQECAFHKVFSSPVFQETTVERGEHELNLGRFAAYFPLAKTEVRTRKWVPSKIFAQQNIYLLYRSNVQGSVFSNEFKKNLNAAGKLNAHATLMAETRGIKFSEKVLNFEQLVKMILNNRVNGVVLTEGYLENDEVLEKIKTNFFKTAYIGKVEYVTYFSRTFFGDRNAEETAEKFNLEMSNCLKSNPSFHSLRH